MDANPIVEVEAIEEEEALITSRAAIEKEEEALMNSRVATPPPAEVEEEEGLDGAEEEPLAESIEEEEQIGPAEDLPPAEVETEVEEGKGKTSASEEPAVPLQEAASAPEEELLRDEELVLKNAMMFFVELQRLPRFKGSPDIRVELEVADARDKKYDVGNNPDKVDIRTSVNAVHTRVGATESVCWLDATDEGDMDFTDGINYELYGFASRPVYLHLLEATLHVYLISAEDDTGGGRTGLRGRHPVATCVFPFNLLPR
jgi:hypothetical protein